MEELLVRTKREKPTFIPYFVSACKALPGKFLLGYQPRGKPRSVTLRASAQAGHVADTLGLCVRRVEYVTITPDGFRYRSQIFPTVNGLFRWFKDHYQEPVPGRRTISNAFEAKSAKVFASAVVRRCWRCRG